MTDNTNKDIKALKAAIEASGHSQLTDKDKAALKNAAAVIHHEVESLDKAAKQFPAAANTDLKAKYSKTEQALHEAIEAGKVDTNTLQGLKAFTRDHERAAGTVQRANDATRTEARNR